MITPCPFLSVCAPSRAKAEGIPAPLTRRTASARLFHFLGLRPPFQAVPVLHMVSASTVRA